jgi:acyl carrier protein
MNNLLSRLQSFFLQQGSETIAPEALLQSYLDSVSMLDFILFIEGEFEVTVDDNDVTPKNFSSLQTVADYLSKKFSQ